MLAGLLIAIPLPGKPRLSIDRRIKSFRPFESGTHCIEAARLGLKGDREKEADLLPVIAALDRPAPKEQSDIRRGAKVLTAGKRSQEEGVRARTGRRSNAHLLRGIKRSTLVTRRLPSPADGNAPKVLLVVGGVGRHHGTLGPNQRLQNVTQPSEDHRDLHLIEKRCPGDAVVIPRRKNIR